MFLENVVFDAVDAQRLGRFWEAVIDGERLTDAPGIYETRLAVPDGPVLDLCFPGVPVPPTSLARLELGLAGGERPTEVVERLLGLGARRLDPERVDRPGTMLADPEGNRFRVVDSSPEYDGSGPLAVVTLDSADPARDAEFWSWLGAWQPAAGLGEHALRHRSQRGPVLMLRPERTPKAAGDKNPIHLDVRLEPGDDADALAAAIAERGGRERFHPDWGAFPWRFFKDPSGNEFCLLPEPSGSAEAEA